MNIKKGDKFYCHTDVCTKRLYYKTGKIYSSEVDNCITDEFGDKEHTWIEYEEDVDDFLLHFRKVAENKQECYQDLERGCECGSNKTCLCGANEVQDELDGMLDKQGSFLDIKSFKSNISPTESLIIKECDDLKALLLEKNRKYSDSALKTGMVFPLSPVISLKARLNDKIARWKNDVKDEDEDISQDILGYIILLRIALKNDL